MFSKDLEKGRIVERQFASKLFKWDISKIEFAPDTQFKDWDLLVTFNKSGKQKTVSYEIKNDKVSPTSGNVGFEYRCNGTPSGVYASKADYIVYYINDTFYYQDRAELLILLNGVPKIEVAGGDGNRSDMYLVSNIYLDKLFKKL